MAHFAKLDSNNIVLEVHVVANAALDANNEEASGIAFLQEWSGGHLLWKQTSYNGNFRKKYAAVGDIYDPMKDIFYSPQPYPSWTLDSNNEWQPPKPQPNHPSYFWDESKGDWISVTQS